MAAAAAVMCGSCCCCRARLLLLPPCVAPAPAAAFVAPAAAHSGTPMFMATSATTLPPADTDRKLTEVRGVCSGWNDGGIHLEAVVVTEKQVWFYQDGRLRANASLQRPVTDCSTEVMYLGSPGLSLGAVNYYASELTETVMKEILAAGFPLKSLGVGSLPHEHIEGLLDPILQDLEHIQTGLSDLQHASSNDVLKQHVITRAASEADAFDALYAPNLVLSKSTACRFRPECFLIHDVNQTLTLDAAVGYGFYALLREPALNATGSAYGTVHYDSLDLEFPVQFPQFEPSAFPSWLGTSMTMTGWVRATEPGYIVSKHRAFEKKRCWTVMLDRNGFEVSGGASATVEGRTVKIPSTSIMRSSDSHNLQNDFFVGMKALRHFAVVFDAQNNSLRAYLDGVFFGEAIMAEDGLVAAMDCAVGDDTYIALGHRAPYKREAIMDIADLRMYVGHALTAEEIYVAAFQSVKRSCMRPNEGYDRTFEDAMGNDCAWYENRRAEDSAQICSAKDVRQACPVACGIAEDCFQPHDSTDAGTAHALWTRIMRIELNAVGATTCLSAATADPVAQCRSLRALNDSHYVGDATTATWKLHLADEKRRHGASADSTFDVRDCEALERSIDPFCSFAHDPWLTSTADSQISNAGGAFTLTWWMKSTRARSLPVQLKPRLAIFFSLAPPLPLLTINPVSDSLTRLTVFNRCQPSDSEGVDIFGMPLESKWTHLTVSLGALDEEGNRRLMVMVQSRVYFDTVIPWCRAADPAARSIVQGVSFQQSMLVSPIEVQAGALPAKASQKVCLAKHGPTSHARLTMPSPKVNQFRDTRHCIAHATSLFTMASTHCRIITVKKL